LELQQKKQQQSGQSNERKNKAPESKSTSDSKSLGSKPEESVLTEIEQNLESKLKVSAEQSTTGNQDSSSKKIKTLKKKLREIDELSSRDPDTLNSDQKEKLTKRSQLEEELKILEI
jgi:ribonuclease HII